MSVKQVINDSSSDFVNIVWPIITESVGGGSIIPVETVTDSEFAKQLDVKGGIDIWQIVGNGLGIRGIASRIQWGRAWDTFTIRYLLFSGQKTEYDKRNYAINNPQSGLLYPWLTIQAYLDQVHGTMISAAIIKTIDLYHCLNNNSILWGERMAPDQNKFKYIAWEKLKECGYKIKIFKTESSVQGATR